MSSIMLSVEAVKGMRMSIEFSGCYGGEWDRVREIASKEMVVGRAGEFEGDGA
jgi:hypothetical protein